MLKNTLSVLLLIMFTNSIVVPAIIILVDCTNDISITINVNEEENKEKEAEKDLEIKILQIENPHGSFMGFSSEIVKLYKMKYSKYYLKLDLPPPEFS